MKKLMEGEAFETGLEIIRQLHLQIALAQDKCKSGHKKFSASAKLSPTGKFDRIEIFNMFNTLLEQSEDLQKMLDALKGSLAIHPHSKPVELQAKV